MFKSQEAGNRVPCGSGPTGLSPSEPEDSWVLSLTEWQESGPQIPFLGPRFTWLVGRMLAVCLLCEVPDGEVIALKLSGKRGCLLDAEKGTLGLGSTRCGFQTPLAPISWQVTSSVGLSLFTE